MRTVENRWETRIVIVPDCLAAVQRLKRFMLALGAERGCGLVEDE